MMTLRTGFVLAIVLVGCIGRGTLGEDSAESRGDSTSHADVTADPGSESVDATETSATSGAAEGVSGGSEVGGYEDDGGADGCAFACPMPGTGGGVTNECDIWAQDCPADQKCMPWANDGGSSWNATRCSPLDPEAADIGDACIVEGSGVSGIDNCTRRSMCWNVDTETNGGTCVPFCVGTEASHGCEDPALTCVVSNQGTLPLCLPPCDPLAPECAEGEGCYPVDGAMACVVDVSGDEGAYGGDCAFINDCDAGLHCAGELVTPDCFSCCTSFCNLDDPDPDASCPDVDIGQVCVPFFELGESPPQQQHVGACLMPK